MSCRGYIQTKVDTLDLFSTVWLVIEKPMKAFHRIAIAVHKNYVFFLAALSGIGHLFFLIYIWKLGDLPVHLIGIMAIGFTAGPILGLAMILLISLVQKGVAALFSLRTNIRQAMAVVAYSSVPIVFTLLFLLPIKLLTFGKYYFTSNPPPTLLKPISYYALLSLDGLCFAWSVVLYVVGLRTLYDVGWGRSAMIASCSIGGIILMFNTVIGSLAHKALRLMVDFLPILHASL